MRFDGSWFPCPDGRLRPVVHGELADGAGVRYRLPFLVDTGADVSVISLAALTEIQFDIPTGLGSQLEGVGGRSESVTLDTPLWLTRETGADVRFHGPFLASPAVDQFGVSVLGRDVLNHFAVIVDRQRDTVCLLAGNHRYAIQGP